MTDSIILGLKNTWTWECDLGVGVCLVVRCILLLNLSIQPFRDGLNVEASNSSMPCDNEYSI